MNNHTSKKTFQKLHQVSNKKFYDSFTTFKKIASDLNLEKCKNEYFIPPLFTRFYDQPIWHELSEQQKIKLNQLTWCQMYHTTAMTESAACILNQKSAHAAFLSKNPEIGFYMIRESAEESFHMTTFITVIQKVLSHYKIPYLDFIQNNGSAKRNSWFFYRALSFLSILFGQWNFYYLSRYSLNIVLKSFERSINEKDEINPLIKELIITHREDEARHMTMSYVEGQNSLSKLGFFRRLLAVRIISWWITHLSIADKPKKKLLYDRHKQNFVQLLLWCDVSKKRANQAYKEWTESTPSSDPIIEEIRRFYISASKKLIHKLELSKSLTRRLERQIIKQFS